MQQYPVCDYCKGRAVCLFSEKTHTHIVGVPYPLFFELLLSLLTLILNVCSKIAITKPWLYFNLKFFSEDNPWFLVLWSTDHWKDWENSSSCWGEQHGAVSLTLSLLTAWGSYPLFPCTNVWNASLPPESPSLLAPLSWASGTVPRRALNYWILPWWSPSQRV